MLRTTMHNVVVSRLLRLSVGVAAIGIIATASGCGSSTSSPTTATAAPEQSAVPTVSSSRPDSLTIDQADATAVALGYKLYWLGPEFTAGNVTFHITVVDPLSPPIDGAVQFEYVGETEPALGVIGLMVAEYAPSAWAKRGFTAPPSKYVTVLGQRSGLHIGYDSVRPVTAMTLVTTQRTTTIMTTARSEGAPSRGAPDVNPLLDETLFLETMNQLRPYPQ